MLNMYINGKMRILIATIAIKTPFFPNNTIGKDAIHVSKIELSVMSDHVSVPDIATSHIQHTYLKQSLSLLQEFPHSHIFLHSYENWGFFHY